MRVRNLLVVLLLLSWWSPSSSAEVLKVVINDTIQAATAERIVRAIDLAAAQKMKPCCWSSTPPAV